MPPFAPLPTAEWPRELADMKEGFAGRLAVYGIMAHHPALLRAWADFREHVVNQNVLGRQYSEVVILRTGHRLNSDYEWQHHICRARACGMEDARIASIAGPLEGMRQDDAVLAGAVDNLLDLQRMSPETAAALTRLAGPEAVMDVIATVGHYSVLAYMLNSFPPPLDEDIARELAEHPLVG